MKTIFNPDKDFVYTTDNNGNYQSGGYKLNNSFISNVSPITTFEFNDTSKPIQHGGNPFNSKEYEHLVIPAGLFMIQRFSIKNLKDDDESDDDIIYEDKEDIDEDLYSKLYGLAALTNEENSKNISKHKPKTIKKSKNISKNKNKKTRKR